MTVNQAAGVVVGPRASPLGFDGGKGGGGDGDGVAVRQGARPFSHWQASESIFAR